MKAFILCIPLILMSLSSLAAPRLDYCAKAYAYAKFISVANPQNGDDTAFKRISTQPGSTAGSVLQTFEISLPPVNTCINARLLSNTDLVNGTWIDTYRVPDSSYANNSSTIPYFPTVRVYIYTHETNDSNLFHRALFNSNALYYYTEEEILDELWVLNFSSYYFFPSNLVAGATITLVDNGTVDQIFDIQSSNTFTNHAFNPVADYAGTYTYSLSTNAYVSTLVTDYPAITNSMTTYTLDWNSTTGGVLSATGEEVILPTAGWTFIYTEN